MSEIYYTFSVLQYRHDAWIGEALNVGVLLSAPDVGFLKIRTIMASSRLEQAYPDLDTKGFQQLLRAIETKVTLFAKEMKGGSLLRDEMTSSKVARKLHTEDDSALHWLESGTGVTSSPKEELDRLFSRYVSRWDAVPSRDAPLSDDLFALREQKLSANDRSILRSFYYRQALPSALLGGDGSAIARKIEVLNLAGLIVKMPEGPRLTGAGVRALKKAYGSKRPPLIDFKHDARLPSKDRKKEFIVGSSLASAIAREVSGGE